VSAARRLGILGGAFDPPHQAHVALALAAIEQLQLDELRIFPTGRAWHKARPLSDAAHRLAMARLAFADLPQAVIDERELRREGPTYTVDTLRELHREHPQDTLVLVIGADQADTFDQWRESDEIARLAIISIAGRPRAQAPAGAVDAARVPGGQWVPIALAPLAVSATDIRERRAAGLGIDHLVPAPVARYIDLHHLYLPA
jgi:nicotinate-nucleotide adenylyltransferase